MTPTYRQVACWHYADMPKSLLHVRYRGKADLDR